MNPIWIRLRAACVAMSKLAPCPALQETRACEEPEADSNGNRAISAKRRGMCVARADFERRPSPVTCGDAGRLRSKRTEIPHMPPVFCTKGPISIRIGPRLLICPNFSHRLSGPGSSYAPVSCIGCWAPIQFLICPNFSHRLSAPGSSFAPASCIGCRAPVQFLICPVSCRAGRPLCLCVDAKPVPSARRA